jgi:hypothetical protein
MRMRGGFLAFVTFLVGVVAAVIVALVAGHIDIPFSTVVTVALGTVCLGWLVTIVVLPWNLHFQARHLLDEIEKSRARGIAVADDQEHKARTVAKRMLAISLGLHTGSAALLGVGASLYGEPVGQVFAGLFLVSTLFRPAVEYYRHLRRQLADALTEVRYPRDDVVTLVQDVRMVVSSSEEHARALADLRHELARVRTEGQNRSEESQRKLDAVARRFEETIDRLTDNQEIISGIKAFLRLVQRPGPLPQG